MENGMPVINCEADVLDYLMQASPWAGMGMFMGAARELAGLITITFNCLLS